MILENVAPFFTTARLAGEWNSGSSRVFTDLIDYVASDRQRATAIAAGDADLRSFHRR